MTTINLLSGLNIMIYTNKNSGVFQKAGKFALDDLKSQNIEGIYGIVYDDYNPNMSIVNEWKRIYPYMKIFYVATRGKTLTMDSKISFYRRMNQSTYTPDTYLNYNDIPKDTSMTDFFFVKTDGGSGANGVNVYKYMDLSTLKIQNSVIQKDIGIPDLYNNKRYKIRVHAILHDKNIYYFKKNWATISGIDYNPLTDNQDLRNMNVIHQTATTLFIIANTIPDYDQIEQNILHALNDVKYYYSLELTNINANEFGILGIDFVVDKDKNVYIIEINHRSNYSHPIAITDKTDIPCIRDLIKLLVTNSIDNTLLQKI